MDTEEVSPPIEPLHHTVHWQRVLATQCLLYQHGHPPLQLGHVLVQHGHVDCPQRRHVIPGVTEQPPPQHLDQLDHLLVYH